MPPAAGAAKDPDAFLSQCCPTLLGHTIDSYLFLFLFVSVSRLAILSLHVLQVKTNIWVNGPATATTYVPTTTSDKLINNLYSSFIAFFLDLFLLRALLPLFSLSTYNNHMQQVCVLGCETC